MNFKDFMANNAQENWIYVRKIYECGDTTIPMEGHDHIWVEHYLSYPLLRMVQIRHGQLCCKKNPKGEGLL